jgi:hypothetical protein
MIEEKYKYGGRYGWIYQNSKSFEDLDFIRENYLDYKIIKVKIWSGKINSKDIINGIQVWYKNIFNGIIITPGEYKGEEGIEKVDEFILQSNEYLTEFHIRIDTEVTQIGLGTNKGNKILVGGTEGEDKYISSNEGENIIIFFYGAYDTLLHSLGVGYMNKKEYLKGFFLFGFLQLRYKLKKDESFKKEWTEKENTLTYNDKGIFKTCLLPQSIFLVIIKFLNIDN